MGDVDVITPLTVICCTPAKVGVDLSCQIHRPSILIEAKHNIPSLIKNNS